MTSLPKPIPGIVAQSVTEGLLLLRENGEYVLINKTSAIIWKLLNQVDDIESLLVQLQRIPGTNNIEELRSQVERFLIKMVKEGFLMEAV